MSERRMGRGPRAHISGQAVWWMPWELRRGPTVWAALSAGVEMFQKSLQSSMTAGSCVDTGHLECGYCNMTLMNWN